MKYTEKELLECAKKIKEYCNIMHYNPDYKGGYTCDYCIFSRKSIKYGEGKNAIFDPPVCCLQDDYGRQSPWFWKLDEVKINEETLF